MWLFLVCSCNKWLNRYEPYEWARTSNVSYMCGVWGGLPNWSTITNVPVAPWNCRSARARSKGHCNFHCSRFCVNLSQMTFVCHFAQPTTVCVCGWVGERVCTSTGNNSTRFVEAKGVPLALLMIYRFQAAFQAVLYSCRFFWSCVSLSCVTVSLSACH